MAAIKGLYSLKSNKTEVTIYSDSKYVVDCVNKGWCFKWKKNGELNILNVEHRTNADLWSLFIDLYELHIVTMEWIKGHNGNKYNEIADKLASSAALSDNLKIDTYYEKFETK